MHFQQLLGYTFNVAVSWESCDFCCHHACVCVVYVVDMLIMMHIGIRCLENLQSPESGVGSLESLLAPTGRKSNNGATAN